MANQEQIPLQQEQPFVAAKKVNFNFEDIILNTNNEVALLYQEHNNQDYFKCVSDFISKCCIRKPFTRSPNMYKEYLAEFWYSATALENSKISFSILTGGSFEEVGVNTFTNAIGAHYLAYSSEYVAPPSIDILRQWFPTIWYKEEVSAKGTLRKSLLPPRWRLLMAQIIQCLGDKPVVFKALKPSSIAERVPQGTKPGAKGHKKKSTSLKQQSMSSKEEIKGGSSKAPTDSKIGLSKKRKESNSAMTLNPSHPPVSTTMDPRMHREDHQATGGITSLGSALGNDASVVSTCEADPGNSAPSTDPHVLAEQTKSVSEGLDTVLTQPLTRKGASSIARQVEEEEASRTIKLEDLAKLVSNVQPSFKDLDLPEDDPVIIVDSHAEEDDGIHAIENSQKHKLELEKNKAEAALLKSQPSFPNVEQLNELLVKSLKTEFSNIISPHDFSNSLPTELKNLPSEFNKLTEEVKELKNQVHNLEIELPKDLKEIPTKLEDFTKTVTSLTSQVAELKTLQ
ncbi:hypothetical protein Tco_1270376 [Tanacetum coccineum]